jgi:hypothetical protein
MEPVYFLFGLQTSKVGYNLWHIGLTRQPYFFPSSHLSFLLLHNTHTWFFVKMLPCGLFVRSTHGPSAHCHLQQLPLSLRPWILLWWACLRPWSCSLIPAPRSTASFPDAATASMRCCTKSDASHCPLLPQLRHLNSSTPLLPCSYACVRDLSHRALSAKFCGSIH